MTVLNGMAKFRGLSTLIARSALARLTGTTFDGNRDLDRALGYKSELTEDDYLRRYRRGGIAKTIVRAFPEGTWRGQGELIEEEDPSKITDFEKAWFTLSDKLQLWPTFLQADVLAGLGDFSALLMLFPRSGRLDAELKGEYTIDDIVELQPIGPADIKVHEYVRDVSNPRFGKPYTYEAKRLSNDKRTRLIHHSRLIHVADEVLDQWGIGTPRLEAVWNRLDDLEKVVGGGSEAYWMRVNPGYQFNLDKDTELGPDEEEALEEQTEDFVNKMSRIMRTRGMDVKPLNAEIAMFDRNADTLMSQISGTSKIPQRILTGSERGQLASSQDRVNWTERVQDRRVRFGSPVVVRPFVKRMTELGVLPEPSKPYQVWWPQVFDLSDKERADIAAKWAEMNQKYRGIVVTDDEIRDLILGLKPLTPAQRKLAIASMVTKQEPAVPGTSGKPAGPQPPDAPANPEDITTAT